MKRKKKNQAKRQKKVEKQIVTYVVCAGLFPWEPPVTVIHNR